MMRTELTMEQMEQVNGGDAKEFFETILEFIFCGMAEDTKNDVPHPHE